MGYVSTVLRIQAALEKAGIQFTEEDASGGIGRPLKIRFVEPNCEGLE